MVVCAVGNLQNSTKSFVTCVTLIESVRLSQPLLRSLPSECETVRLVTSLGYIENNSGL